MIPLIACIVLAVLPLAFGVIRRAEVYSASAFVLIIGTVVGPLFFGFDLAIALSFDRLLLVIIYLVVAYRMWRGKLEVLPSLYRIDFLLFFFCFWLLFQSIGVDPGEKQQPSTSRWLTFIAIPLAMYWLGRLFPKQELNSKGFSYFLVALGLYLGVTGIFEVTGQYSLVFPTYVADTSYWEFLGRARGPLLNPTANGTLLTTCLAAAGSMLFSVQHRFRPVMIAICGIILIGCVATLTRSVWMGCILTIGIGVLVFARQFAMGLVMLFIALGMLAVTIGPSTNLLAIKRDKHLSAADAAESVTLRPLLAVVAWEMFKDSPVIGHGYGGYVVTSAPYHDSTEHELPLDNVRAYIQHNVFLSILVDGGLFALLPFVIWIGWTFWIAWRMATNRSRNPAIRHVAFATVGFICAYCVNGMFHDVSLMPMMNNYLFFLGGVMVNCARAAECNILESQRRPSFVAPGEFSAIPAT